jgi:hypothetical protein
MATESEWDTLTRVKLRTPRLSGRFVSRAEDRAEPLPYGLTASGKLVGP